MLPHVIVQNANAMSSPFTHGFPAMASFVGFMWALQRAISDQIDGVQFVGIAPFCHDYQEQATASSGTLRFHQSAKDGYDGKKYPSIIEEARIHLDLSITIAVTAQDVSDEQLSVIAATAKRMRVAGGPIVSMGVPRVVDMTGDADEQKSVFQRMCARLLPGFVLVDRPSLIQHRLDALRESDETATRMDAWLSFSKRTQRYNQELGSWQYEKAKGWLVPIPVGYARLGQLYPEMKNQRDTNTPFGFVESVFSIGEWVGAHRIESPQSLFWYATTDHEIGTYRCNNDYEIEGEQH